MMHRRKPVRSKKKTLWRVLVKSLLASSVLWLWSANCSAYDFEVTCSGTSDGNCAPGASFSLHKLSTAHDSVALPFSPTAIQIYLANCPSDTSCQKLVGPVWDYGISFPAWGTKTWGYLGANYITRSGNVLNGVFASGANGGTANPTWNGNIYKNLCLSITAVNPSNGWAIWGINYTYPSGQVMCSVPINRTVADTCSVTNSQIDVAFGQIERSEIGTTTGAATDQKKTLSMSCTGTATHKFSLKLNMTPTSWSASQIATSNTALGVSISKDGAVLSNGDAFDMSVAGSASTDLTFSVLKNPSVANSTIATGDFTASATLIVTEL